MNLPNKYFILLSFCLFFIGTLAGQQVTISGQIPGADSAELKVMVYQDFISYHPQTVSRVILDDKGRFELFLDLVVTRQVLLEIEHYSLGLFLEPGGFYYLECDSVHVKGQLRPMYNKEALPCGLISEPDPGLNSHISAFNHRFNEFILREFGGIYQRRNTNILNEFREVAISDYEQYDHAFLLQYIKYKIAIVELAMAPAKKAQLFSTMINDQPVLLNNPEYMNFFHEFFDHQMYPDNKFIQRQEFDKLINYQVNYPALIDSLGKDSTLRNELIRELVCMNMLGEFYRNNEFSKSNILALLDFIHKNSKFHEHRNIAQNLSEELTLLQKGSKPPELQLSDLEGEMVHIDDMKGKPVYVIFFTTWSFGCLTELELMKDLYQEYKNDIHFIGVSFDREVEIVQQLIKEKGYEWTFLHNGMNNDVISDFRIQTFPVFLLLDKKGNVSEYPAFKPSEIIRKQFDQLLERK